MEASRHRLKYAIVVKGPLVAFTRACMGHYLTTMPDVGVVFSHNRGCAGSAAQQPTLEELQNRYPATFGFVLAEPPLELGIGFRNVQREATYHGVRHAIELWRPRWVLVHRPDAGFVQPHMWIWSLNKGGPGTTAPLHGEPGLNVMERLAAVALAQPPVVFSSRDADGSRRPMAPLSRRLGVCPFQMHLTTFYGHYTVDDHCMFGLAHDVLAFWSLAPPYCRECVSSSELDPNVLALPQKRLCRKPGTEQENGILWVEWMMHEGWAPPNTTLKLLEQQLWVLNPLPFGYVRFTKTSANRTVKFPLEGNSRAIRLSPGAWCPLASSAAMRIFNSPIVSTIYSEFVDRCHLARICLCGRALTTGKRPSTTARTCATTRAIRNVGWWPRGVQA